MIVLLNLIGLVILDFEDFFRQSLESRFLISYKSFFAAAGSVLHPGLIVLKHFLFDGSIELPETEKGLIPDFGIDPAIY